MGTILNQKHYGVSKDYNLIPHENWTISDIMIVLLRGRTQFDSIKIAIASNETVA